jgi:hypothetical protein
MSSIGEVCTPLPGRVVCRSHQSHSMLESAPGQGAFPEFVGNGDCDEVGRATPGKGQRPQSFQPTSPAQGQAPPCASPHACNRSQPPPRAPPHATPQIQPQWQHQHRSSLICYHCQRQGHPWRLCPLYQLGLPAIARGATTTVAPPATPSATSLTQASHERPDAAPCAETEQAVTAQTPSDNGRAQTITAGSKASRQSRIVVQAAGITRGASEQGVQSEADSGQCGADPASGPASHLTAADPLSNGGEKEGSKGERLAQALTGQACLEHSTQGPSNLGSEQLLKAMQHLGIAAQALAQAASVLSGLVQQQMAVTTAGVSPTPPETPFQSAPAQMPTPAASSSKPGTPTAVFAGVDRCVQLPDDAAIATSGSEEGLATAHEPVQRHPKARFTPSPPTPPHPAWHRGMQPTQPFAVPAWFVRPPPVCYWCQGVGHIKRFCPLYPRWLLPVPSHSAAVPVTADAPQPQGSKRTSASSLLTPLVTRRFNPEQMGGRLHTPMATGAQQDGHNLSAVSGAIRELDLSAVD